MARNSGKVGGGLDIFDSSVIDMLRSVCDGFVFVRPSTRVIVAIEKTVKSGELTQISETQSDESAGFLANKRRKRTE